MGKGLSKAERHSIKRDGVRLELREGSGISYLEWWFVRPKWWRRVAAPEIRKRARWSWHHDAWISKRDPYWEQPVPQKRLFPEGLEPDGPIEDMPCV